MEQVDEQMIGVGRKYLSFMLFTGRFGVDLPLWGSVAVLAANYFWPNPDWIYAGEVTVLKIAAALCYRTIIWVGIAYVLTFGVARLLGGPRFASQTVRFRLAEDGFDDALSLPWWDMVRFRGFWFESLLYALSGLLFIYIGYRGAVHEWSQHPWF